jgi:FixJ family two-component response regulator
MHKSRVIIVEDDIALKQSLAEWLAPSYLVKSFESAELFLRFLINFELEDGIPTCILLDFQMPGMNGVELQRTLKEMNIEYPIIFISGNALQADIVNAWREGAVDFMLKPFTGIEISKCLDKIFSKSIQLRSDKGSITKVEELINVDISSREAEVLLLLGQGHRQAEVAQILGIGLRTIKMHRTSLKNKLNLNTPVELIRFVDRHSTSLQKITGKTDPD